MRTKYRKIDQAVGGGFRKGHTSVLFGPPGNAKSMFVMNLLADAIKNRRSDIYYIPLEYSKIDHVLRFMAVEINSWNVVSENSEHKALVLDLIDNDKAAQVLLDRVDHHIAENPGAVEISDNGYMEIPKVDYGRIIQEISAHAKERDMIVIDPITAIDPNEGDRKAIWEQQKSFVKSCNAIAKRDNCHIMLLSHCGKRQKHNGKESKLTMDDMAGAADIGRFTQYIFILDFHDKKTSSAVNYRKGMPNEYKNVEHTRTMLIAKTNFGKGKGYKFALDFTEGPDMQVLGVIHD